MNKTRSFPGWLLLLGLFLLLPISAPAIHPLEVIAGNLRSHLFNTNNYPLPVEGDSRVYRPPSQEELDTFRSVVRTVLAGDYVRAAEIAADIDYRVIYYRHTGSPTGNHIILREDSDDPGHHGVYVFRIDPVRDLIMESPHPLFDGTWFQGIDLYIETESLAYIQAGTHRRNSPDETPCDGTLQGEANRISDMAHVVDSFFQVAHEELHLHYLTAVCVSVHGMAANTHASDVIISNGTTGTASFADSLSRQLTAKMNELLVNDPAGRFAVSHQEPGASYPLSGSTNKQGRFSNGSPDPCLVSVANAPNPERFIHLEQAPSVRNTPASNWRFVIDAFNELVPLHPPLILAPGPALMNLAHWPFDGNLTETVAGRDGTASGTPLPASGRPGRLDGSLSFNGSSDYVTLPVFDYLGGHQEFTLSFWFSTEQNGSSLQYMISHGPVGYSFISDVDRLNMPSSFHLYTVNGGGGTLRMRFTTDNGTFIEYNDGTGGLLNGEWHHLALTHSWQAGTRIWLNGEEEAFFPETAGSGFNPEMDIIIGTRTDASGNRFFGHPDPEIGRINDIRIFNRAMGQTQIQRWIDEDLAVNYPTLWKVY
ncbi:MAG: LamG domain-containing protein [Candidatus Sumerlaeia bacterium]|nr:LamG domain-containing protein [Candidatus Sumerlaeia bacterium]